MCHVQKGSFFNFGFDSKRIELPLLEVIGSLFVVDGLKIVSKVKAFSVAIPNSVGLFVCLEFVITNTPLA